MAALHLNILCIHISTCVYIFPDTNYLQVCPRCMQQAYSSRWYRKSFVSGQIVNKYKYEENLQARRNKAPLWCRKWNPIDAALLNYAVIFSMNAYILSFCCCHISCACYIWLVLPKTKKRLENMTRQEFCLALSKPALIQQAQIGRTFSWWVIVAGRVKAARLPNLHGGIRFWIGSMYRQSSNLLCSVN